MILLTVLALGLLMLAVAGLLIAAVVLGGLAGLVRAFTPAGRARVREVNAHPSRWERVRRATEGVDSW